MNLDQLPYIVAIASAGSLSAAAKHLDVTQQALSKYLSELEAETGLELFFRSKRRYLPTPAGRVYIQAAQQILELQRHTRSAVAALNGSGPSQLRLGVSPNRGVALLAELYPLFDQRFPQIELALTEGYANELGAKLRVGALDAMISTHSGAIPPGFQAVSFRADELILAVPAFHPLAGPPVARLEELPFADLHDFWNDIFIQPLPASNQYQLVQELFRAAHFQPQVTATLPNIHLQLAMIRSGARVGLVPSHYLSAGQGIAFFRLHDAPRLILAYMTQAGHTCSEAERFLIWLITDFYRQAGDDILWSDPLREICREFGAAEFGGLA